MTNTELRARIRDLVPSGDLPDERPVVQNAGDGFRGFTRDAPCLICGEADATTAYFWTSGRVAHLHAACNALWKQERRVWIGSGL